MAEHLTYQDLILRVQELERNEKILKERTERLESAIDAVEGGVCDFDPCTGKAYFSPRWFTMLGYEAGDFPVNYETWASLLHPDDKEDAEKAICDFLKLLRCLDLLCVPDNFPSYE